MRYRQDVRDIFSTYIQFESEQFRGWLPEPRLRRSIEKCLAETSDEQLSKHFWALYWYQHWCGQTHRLALMHLGAHLQEAGYWAAYKLTSRFELKQFSLADCFQVAFTKLEKGLSSFQPDRGTTLESFVKLFFSSTITNELRRTQELDPCSDWSLLRKTSRVKLLEALQAAGLSNQSIEQHRLAWQCFKHLYAQSQATGTQQLSAPNRDTWMKIASLYNQERLSQLTFPSQTVTAEQLASWLLDCSGWIRAYLKPSVTSLNTPIPGNESFELQDRLPADELSPVEQLLEHYEQLSRQDQQIHLRQFLENSLNCLDKAERSLLQLYYKENLTQQKIAKQLNIKQYTVSRKLTGLRKKLLNALVDWCEQTADWHCTPADIEQAAEVLELWLQEYFDPLKPTAA